MVMRFPLFALILALAPPALADTPEAVEDIRRGYDGFAVAAAALATDAGKSCDPQALRPGFNATYDAWAEIGFLHVGPTEEEGRGLAILFWPDPKALGAKAQRGLLLGDPADLTPERFAKQSVAARGLAGLERLLYAKEPPDADPCPLIRATADDLARLADEIAAGWQGDTGFAGLLLTAGAAENSRYLSPTEARQAIFTQLMGGLEFVSDQRLGRPMGTFDRPRPERAEARLSARSQRNVALSLQGMRRLARALVPEAADTLAAFDRAIALAGKLDDADFAGAATPEGRLKLEILQNAVRGVRATALTEMAPALGVGIGFNSQDGD